MSEHDTAEHGALHEAWAIQTRASTLGFDWDDVSGVLAKVHEEVGEVEAALAEGKRIDAQRELGDLLFAVVNLARFLEADPETQLHDANARFHRRFATLERMVAETGRAMRAHTLAELDVFWDRIKACE